MVGFWLKLKSLAHSKTIQPEQIVDQYRLDDLYINKEFDNIEDSSFCCMIPHHIHLHTESRRHCLLYWYGSTTEGDLIVYYEVNKEIEQSEFAKYRNIWIYMSETLLDYLERECNL